MKSLLFVFVTFLTLYTYGQYEHTSFYFSIENLKDQVIFEGFESEEIGFYSINEESRRHLMVDRDSISVRSGFEIVIPKKLAMEKGFTFRDNKMFGMEPYNGIHYKEFNDTIFALYYQYDHYFSPADIMIMGEKGYFVFTQEQNDFYSCEYISFKGEEIAISSIDHASVMKQLLKLSSIYQKDIDNISTYIAQPTLKELEILVKKDCFNDLRTYPKVEHL